MTRRSRPARSGWVSYARPGKLFTASQDLVTGQLGVLTPDALTRIVDAVVGLLRRSVS